MIALELLAAIVTILSGFVAALIWMNNRIVALRRENEALRAHIREIETAPRQPADADYLVDDDGSRLCIHCYNTSQKRWKLLRDETGWTCPVCGTESRREATPTAKA